MAAKFKNFATAKLTQNLSSSATTANVDSGASLPDANGSTNWFYLLLQKTTDTSYFEIVKVTNKVGNVLTIVREQEGTIGRAFVVGDLAEARLTNQGLVDAFVDKDVYAQDRTGMSASFDALSAKNLSQDVLSAMRTKEQDEAMREANNNLYAASGFVHFGKHANTHSDVVVGDGLWSSKNDAFAGSNILVIGGTNIGGFSGGSESRLPVLNIAGVRSSIEKLQTTNAYQGLIKFPEAEKGTRTYDSATGVSFDFATQVDPKYGDVAATQNEAVARAFEGVVVNGDMRNGAGEWSPYASGVFTLNNGVARYERVSAEGLCQVTNNVYWHSLLDNKTCTVSIEVLAGGGIFIIQSSVVSVYAELKVGHNEFTFYKDDLTGMVAIIRLGDTVGSFCEFGALSIRASTNKVVTDREDVWGFEQWLENVTEANPYVYPNGLVQSKAPDINGVPTSRSNRPITYYAAFWGDTTSDGRGVNWFTASDAEKKAIASNPDNNLLYNPVSGNVQQWRVRQRTFAGVGDGSWLYTNSAETNVNYPKFLAGFDNFGSNRLVVQGQEDSAPIGTDPFYATTAAEAYNPHPHVGVFTSSLTGANGAGGGVDGHCYFLVCGTVSRLNQGAYHPSFNPMGSQGWNKGDGWAEKWTNGGVVVPLSPVMAFKKATVIGGIGLSYNTNTGGSIASVTANGRPDERRYDAIYSSGQGGVCRDMRYSAFGLEKSDFSLADFKVKNGTYRGYEKQVRTELFDFTLKYTSTYAGGFYYRFNEAINPATYSKKGTAVYFPRTGLLGFVCVPEFSDNGAVYLSSNKRDAMFGLLNLSPLSNASLQIGDRAIIINEVELESSVGGDFLHTDVVGNPAQLLLIPALSDGWLGSWLPVIPDGVARDTPFTRKHSGNIATFYNSFSENTGASWAHSVSDAMSSVTNAVTGVVPSGYIGLWAYTAKAKQTEPTAKASVYSGISGVASKVDVLSWYGLGYGTSLVESCLGKVLTNNNSSSVVIESVTVASMSIDPDGLMHWYRSAQSPKHLALSLGSPLNSATAFKALSYNVNSNQQASIHYAYTELKYGGSDWGDDGFVSLVDYQSSKADLNGNMVLVGTAKLKEPIGWIKNKI